MVLPGRQIQIKPLRLEVITVAFVMGIAQQITQPPLAADAWAAEVTKMVKTYGASIPDDASQKILQYLQSHYTPDKRKH